MRKGIKLVAVAAVLLAAGAVAAADIWGAAAYGTAADVKAELKAGANVNARNSVGSTALALAAMFNQNADVTKALLAAGADVNVRLGDKRYTVLMNATVHNTNPDVVKVLIEAGADKYARDKNGNRAIDWLEMRKGKDTFYGTKPYWEMYDMLY